MIEATTAISRPPPKSKLRRWVAKLGMAGFLFFLIKGLLWLLVPAALAYFGSRG